MSRAEATWLDCAAKASFQKQQAFCLALTVTPRHRSRPSSDKLCLAVNLGMQSSGDHSASCLLSPCRASTSSKGPTTRGADSMPYTLLMCRFQFRNAPFASLEAPIAHPWSVKRRVTRKENALLPLGSNTVFLRIRASLPTRLSSPRCFTLSPTFPLFIPVLLLQTVVANAPAACAQNPRQAQLRDRASFCEVSIGRSLTNPDSGEGSESLQACLIRKVLQLCSPELVF